jgi:hypothetical protein
MKRRQWVALEEAAVSPLDLLLQKPSKEAQQRTQARNLVRSASSGVNSALSALATKPSKAFKSARSGPFPGRIKYPQEGETDTFVTKHFFDATKYQSLKGSHKKALAKLPLWFWFETVWTPRGRGYIAGGYKQADGKNVDIFYSKGQPLDSIRKVSERFAKAMKRLMPRLKQEVDG